MKIKKIVYSLIFILNIIFCFAQNKTQPNILFIAVDDMNDWIGPLEGLSIAKTPNLDRLASESVVFTNAHCASPACAPSRLSIMTGVQPSKTDVMQNVWYDGPKWRNIPILKDIETIEQFFKNRGYETLAGGKIYHSLAPPWLTSNQAEPEAWDFYFPSVHVPIPYQVRGKKEVIDPAHFVGKRHPYFTWGALDVADQKMADYQVVDWARYELSKKHEKPFYLACGLFRPHMPWEVPRKYFDMYPVEEIPELKIKENDLEDAFVHQRRKWHKFVLDNDQWKYVIQAYLASISFADDQIGRLLEGLDNSEHRDNTIVVLWSDHGMHIGEKENWEKFTLWEESTRVPFFVRQPGSDRAGTRCDQPVSLLDIYPTLAELAGFDIPSHCDGKSIVPQLRNSNEHRKYSALTSYRFNSKQKETVGHALRSLNYRYICYPFYDLEELYDHNNDPDEFNNLAYDKKYAQVIKDFRSELTSRVKGIDLKSINEFPEGYSIKEGRITKDKFVNIYQVVNDPE